VQMMNFKAPEAFEGVVPLAIHLQAVLPKAA
jgi:hypothetical protein